MSDETPSPNDPPVPEIDPALAREIAAPPADAGAEPSAGATSDGAAVGDDAPLTPPAPPSTDDPEVPGASLEARVEALLFVSAEPLPLRRLKELLRVDDGRVVREALDALARGCETAGRAVRVEETAGGFVLRTRPEFAPLAARMGRKVEAEKLSPAALETLAIVAYRQPVLRADIEKIRGVASGEVLRALVERNLVRIAGRADLPGSPLYYGTTARFLEIFGLADLAQLPRDAEALRERG